MASPTWIFDRGGASGQKKGGKSGDQVVGTKIGTLTRESTQNCRDQWLKNGQPVQVRFSVITLSGQRKADFLKALDWKELGSHIDAAAEFRKSTPLGKQLKKARARIDADDLVLLRIDDFNTNGLLGGEDEDNKNFKNLCKDEFVTPDTEGRGGSYGLGKQVYHRFSSISAVVYSSFIDGLVDGKKKTGMRLFGRSQLVSHNVSQINYAPDGWFGRQANAHGGVRAESIWDDAALMGALQVGRDPADGRGTSILVIGFFDPESGSSENPDPVEMATRIIDEAEKWFWPSLGTNNPSIAIEAQVIKDGTVLQKFSADPQKDWAHYIRAYEAPATGEVAKVSPELAETNLTFRVPERVDDEPHNAFDTTLQLRITREPSSSKAGELGRIAVVRGFGMVVKYFQPRNRPLSSDPFCGVLKAGTAAGTGADFDKAEEFFRASEPPLHDQWEHDTDAVRENYGKGAGVAFNSLWNEVAGKVVDLCGIPKPDDDKGPKLLSKLLPFGATPGEGYKKTIIINDVDAQLTDTGWEVRGSIINTKPNGKPWTAYLLFYLRGEKGKGDGLAFTSLNLTSGTVIGMGPRAQIEVPAGKNEIEFTGMLDVAGMAITELRRIKLAYEQ